MNQDEIKNNLLNPDQWIRILFMAGYALAAWAVLFVLLITLFIQLVMVLVVGKANANLQKMAYAWTRYLQQIIYFLTYISDEKPFPFSDFPSSEGLADLLAAQQEATDADRQTEARAQTANESSSSRQSGEPASFTDSGSVAAGDGAQAGAATGSDTTAASADQQGGSEKPETINWRASGNASPERGGNNSETSQAGDSPASPEPDNKEHPPQ